MDEMEDKVEVCVVKGCTAEKRKTFIRVSGGISLHLHKFPVRNLKKRKKWIRIIRRSRKDETWNPHSSSFVCSRHFEGKPLNCKTKKGKYRIPLPTLNLSYEKLPKKKVAPQFIVCSVKNCFSSSEHMTPGRVFYPFPFKHNNKEQLEKWVAFTEREDVNGKRWCPDKDSFICDDHFVDHKKSYDPQNPNFSPSIRPPPPPPPPPVQPRPTEIQRIKSPSVKITEPNVLQTMHTYAYQPVQAKPIQNQNIPQVPKPSVLQTKSPANQNKRKPIRNQNNPEAVESNNTMEVEATCPSTYQPQAKQRKPICKTLKRCISCTIPKQSDRYVRKVTPGDKIHNLKWFVCKILKLDGNLLDENENLPFCVSCMKKLENLYESHIELQALQLKVDTMKQQFMKDIVSSYVVLNKLGSSETGISSDSVDQYVHRVSEIKEGIFLKWSNYNQVTNKDSLLETKIESFSQGVDSGLQEGNNNCCNPEESYCELKMEDAFELTDRSVENNNDAFFTGEEVEIQSDDVVSTENYPESEKNSDECVINGPTAEINEPSMEEIAKSRTSGNVCKICSKNYINIMHFQTHMVEAHGIRHVSKNNNLLIRKLNAKRERIYCCDYCIPSKPFKGYAEFQNHIANRHVEFKQSVFMFYNCQYESCLYSYSEKSSLNSHLSNVHNKSSKMFTCQDCQETFSLMKHLKMHIRRCHNKKYFGCEYCSMQFETSADVQDHLHEHRIIYNPDQT